MTSPTVHPEPWPWNSSKVKVLLKDDAPSVRIRIDEIGRVRAALKRRATGQIRLRIISIYSSKTIFPLDVTHELLVELFEAYNIHREFADVVASFGQEPNLAERSSNNSTIDIKETGDCDISYQIRYIDNNHRGGQDPWSLRHSGVFHQHSAHEAADTVVLLHPVRQPLIDKAIAALKGDAIGRSKICENPFLLHTLMFAQYFANWRWYLRYVGERFAYENNIAMVEQPEDANPQSSFRRVQGLRNTMDLVLSTHACCSGNLDLIQRLSRCSQPAIQRLQSLESAECRMKGYIESADVLKGRVQNLIDLIGYTLTLHNQMEAAKIDNELRSLTEQLKNLTEDTVDDSATVKIITLVSAVYLPGSFIATLFGMNFFLFDTETRKLVISPNFWIFIATWLPLIFLTGAVYVLILFMNSRSKKKPFSLWGRRSTESIDAPREKVHA
ncbi:hypothetical protein SNOG_09966 [Parastagonospora nodorum SN15]|uniref:CorA-like transporter domain-containing protein n=1 Tax=Phaeosphaeria nodorum (strain SN15 / ATCC MYA-4574 / FGSC 10173) TaxID=321614 RepID=Q0UE48_PHANO|nr:hypothetical protein SNOG_09966 [Parastagonospora nodorum SN15]EAT82301.1 hypothetical protein SNOG_09966 [Parastagonospora nodorum SN15]